MLKKLTPRHMDMIRRLLVAESPAEICLELGVSESYLSVLQIDPLFKSKLGEMQLELDERFMEGRANAMQVLEGAAMGSAQVVIQAATEGRIANIDPDTGSIDYKEVSVANQLKSAWDVLDHTGNKAPDKKVIGFFDAAELVKEAYAKKYRGNGGDNSKAPTGPPTPVNSAKEPDVDEESDGAFDVLEATEMNESEGVEPLLLMEKNP